MENSLRHPKRYPASLPRATDAPEAGNLRRSTRLGRLPTATAGLAPSQFTSNKRKRALSTSTERSRASKRSHFTDISPAPPLPSTRSQRHRRRHPSVFDEDDLVVDLSGASTSYLPPDSARRTRKKENLGSSTLKGKEKAHPHLSDDSLDHTTRSRTRNSKSLPAPSVALDGAPTKSEPASELPSVSSGRRLRSSSPNKISVRALSKKRKRSLTTADSACKKAKTDDTSDITIPYPMSLPNPIPTLTITPPSPPPSPSPKCNPELPIISQSAGEWEWPLGTQPVLPTECPALDTALSSYPVSEDATPGRPPSGASRGRRIRRGVINRVTDRPPESLFKLACRERVDYLKLYYLGQLQDYEADQAFAFFTRISGKSSLEGHSPIATQPTPSTSPLVRPQSPPTWNFVSHWQDRVHNAGDWDGRIYAMHHPPSSPTGLPPSMFTLSSGNDSGAAWTEVLDGELDFRTEDCFPFELAESDEEEEERGGCMSSPNDEGTSSTGAIGEEQEDTESDESEESEDLSSSPPVQGESEIELSTPMYTPTPSSLAEALTPLIQPDMQQSSATAVFALPVPPPPKIPEPPTPPPPPFITRVHPKEEEPRPPPPPLSLPPPALATIVPEETRLHDSDQLSAMFQQEILPPYAVARVKSLFQSDSPTTFSLSSPSLVIDEIRRQAHSRLHRPYTRVLNYASKRLGSIGYGTPIDPKRRRNVVAWLEDRKLVNLCAAPEPFAHGEKSDIRVPPLGSAAWYATRFPSTLDTPPVLSSIVPQSAAPVSSSDSTREQASFDAGNWPPLTVEPSDLERFSSQRWSMETKSYFEGGLLAPADLQSVHFQRGSSCDDGVNHSQYPYRQTVGDRGSSTSNDSAFASSTFNPEIAIDDNLSDEDAEGDIDPDVAQPIGFHASSTPSSSSLTIGETQGGLLTTTVHDPESYSSPGSPHTNSHGAVGFGGSELRDGTRIAIYAGSNDFHDIGVHAAPQVEMPLNANRSFAETSLATFSSESGIHGGMNLNVGVSVGFGMGRFDMIGMGVGFGMGMGIGFPTMETDSWFLPVSPPSLSPPHVPSEDHDHGLGSFGSNSLFSDMPDHARERFSSPGSPESAYPLGFAMG